MYLVIETYTGCQPEIPTVAYASREAALEALDAAGQQAARVMLERGEDPWGNGTSGLSLSHDLGNARVWGNGRDPVWTGTVVRIPDTVAGE